MNYLIGFLVALEASLLLLDQTFYWRSIITISIFLFYALNTFEYKRLRSKLPNYLFIVLCFFLIYFYLNYDYAFFPEFYSRWGITQQIYYFFSTPILIFIFLLIQGIRDNKNIFEFIFSFTMSFAFLGFLLNVANFHGTENENFLAVRFIALIPLCFIFFKSFIARLIIFSTIIAIIDYYNSRTIIVAILFFIFLYSLRSIIFSSKKLFTLINLSACLALTLFPALFLFAFQDDTFLTGLFLTDDKGVDGRFLIWAEILLRTQENFIFGHGSNHDTLYYESRFFGRNLSSHNMLLETIFRLGLVGYFIMISTLFLILNYCYENKETYSVQLGWILLICSMFVASLYENIFFDGSGILNNIVLWFTLATLLWVDGNEKASPTS